VAYSTPRPGKPGPAGSGDYIVVDGDCIESIAVKMGHFWETIWRDPQNASLRQARGSPNVLLPGDRVHIPDRVPKTVDRAADRKHRFVRAGTPSKLRLCVKQVGTARGNQPYRLEIGGKVLSGNTDANGWIEVVIPSDASSGRLTVGDNPRHQQVFSLQLGGMDPITETIGVQKRLRNLGFDCEPTGEMDDATSTAIALFQKSEDLEATGELDQSTIDKLKARYGS